MKKTLNILTILFLFSCISSQAFAIPLSLDMTKDELTEGAFVYHGDIDDSFALLPAGSTRTGFEFIATHWRVVTTITKVTIDNLGPFYDLKVEGRHTSKPPPDPDEVSPGLLLTTVQFNLGGVANGLLALQDAGASLIHPGSKDHYDVMTTHVDDLNVGGPGFLTFDNQLSARINFVHTPEPASFLLFGAGLLGLTRLRKNIKTL